MKNRVTDLDRFSLEQVWRPFQNMITHEQRLNAPPCSLDETALRLTEDTEWSRRVLCRIRAIGFAIPSYIHHPLADVVRAVCDEEESPIDRLLDRSFGSEVVQVTSRQQRNFC